MSPSNSATKRVFIIGATGFIGHEAALFLRHDNLIVYGLARSIEKAENLLKDEIIPILHTTDDVNYLDAIVELGITHIIDLSGTPTSTSAITEKLVSIKKSKNYHVGFIYISGIWVHGSSAKQVDESHFPQDEQVKPLVRWRPALERKLLSYKHDLPTIVIRPGLLYGKNSPILGVLFGQIVQAVVTNDASDINLPLNKNLTTSLIHVSDLGQFIAKVIQRFELYNSTKYELPVFDVINESLHVPKFVEQSATQLGFNGTINFIGEPTVEQNIFLNGFNTSVIATNTRAKQLFDWSPKLDIVNDSGLFIKAWAAGNNKEFVKHYLSSSKPRI